MPSAIETLVYERLDNAKDNGYTVFLAGSPADIASDLIEFDSECENHLEGELIPHIISWQAKNGTPTS